MKSSTLVFFYAGLVTAEPFDYIIVGAGTSGLVVANRLSEDPSVTVAVIEPGTDQRNNPNVTNPQTFIFNFGTPLDWQYFTTKQPGANGSAIQLHQGKAWGGSSAINGMTYIRGDAAQVDSWEELGSQGWNWAALEPWYKKAEKCNPPTKSQVAAGATYEAEHHGFEGPVHVSYIKDLHNGSFAPVVKQTWEALSVPPNPDLNSGDVHGWSMGPQTLDRELNLRWDAARAYYLPVEVRTNLKIFQGTAKRITWTEAKLKETNSEKPKAVADGVEYLTDDGTSHMLKATKEVVISAGTVRTPLVLEGSGIGNPTLLKALGIDTVIDLPSVGENYLEQTNHIFSYENAGKLESSPSAYHTFVDAADVFGADSATVEKTTRDSLHKWAQLAVDAAPAGALDVAAVESILQIQHDLIFKRNVTIGEIVTAVTPGAHASNYWYLLPFSRGSVHLQAADRLNEPLINPQFLSVDIDVNATMAVGKIAHKFWLTEPMKKYVGEPQVPGPEVLPNDASDDQWRAYLHQYVAANSHGMGTAAMMARELGGVVDHELRVYGTANVRVVDASVIPMQISGHMTATLYAVAERASDIIKRTAFGRKL